jgi:hypothetical protein
MRIEIHADEVGKLLVEETHDIHICFLNAYFEKIAMQYKGGYLPYLIQVSEGLSGNALLVMEDIVKNYHERHSSAAFDAKKATHSEER